MASPVFASNWVVIGRADNALTSIDTESIGPVMGKFRQVWEKVVYEPPKPDGTTKTVSLWYYNCPDRLAAVKAYRVFISTVAEPPMVTVPNEALVWAPSPPDSIGAQDFKVMCK